MAELHQAKEKDNKELYKQNQLLEKTLVEQWTKLMFLSSALPLCSAYLLTLEYVFGEIVAIDRIIEKGLYPSFGYLLLFVWISAAVRAICVTFFEVIVG